MPNRHTARTLLPGETFGRLTIVEDLGCRLWYDNQLLHTYRCRCECGTFKDVPAPSLKSGNTRSCGCLKQRPKKEKLPKPPRVPTHGLSRHPIDGTYDRMLKRCYDPENQDWEWYGGRQPNPVTVCPEWLEDRVQFFNDMLPTWAPGLTIDRKDTNGPYSKDNCRWITIQQQQRNRRSARMVLFDGELMGMTDAADIIGWNRHRVKDRLNRHQGELITIEGHTIQDIAPVKKRILKNKS